MLGSPPSFIRAFGPQPFVRIEYIIMNLRGSITELQDRISKLYLKHKQQFSENILIRDLWSAMAKDVDRQTSSLEALPVSFWNQLKNSQDGLCEAIQTARQSQIIENKEDFSLRACFAETLSIEEPTILKVYVPIIRKLRENWTDHALDFYIMVKAHLARIVRMTASYSGDPLLMQRSNLLLINFEREVQEPQIPIIPSARKIHAVRPAADAKIDQQKKKARQVAKPPKKAHSPIKHAKIRTSRAKSLGTKMSLRRRRARR